MKAPPPMPDDEGFTTPKHNADATAASTAFPFFSSKIVLPISEHNPTSVATAPYRTPDTRWCIIKKN